MTLQELLKAQGLSEEQVKAILGAMKENKIYTASEENLDTRYGKLKTDHETLNTQYSEANKLIETLKASNKGNEDLQAKVTTYEGQISELQEQLQQTQLESAIKLALLDANATDVDYMTFKLKEKGEIALDENGKIKGIEDKIAGLKTQFPTQFENKQQNKVDPIKLPNDPTPDDKTQPATLAGALKAAYETAN